METEQDTERPRVERMRCKTDGAAETERRRETGEGG